MEKYVEKLVDELNFGIKKLEKQEPDLVKFSKEAFRICEEKKQQMKDYLLNHNFESQEQEINFFKYLKPKLETKSIFYCQLHEIESKILLFSKENKIAQCTVEINKIMSFFKSKKGFTYFQYYRTQNNLMDQFYFVRQKTCIYSFSNFENVDFNFSTGHDVFFNKIAALEELVKYLELRILALEVGDNIISKNLQSKLNWTSNKVDLVEVMYGLFANKSINNGDIELSKLAEAFQSFFNVDFGDFYRIYSEMKIRSNRVKFLEKVIDSLENKMDNDV